MLWSLYIWQSQYNFYYKLLKTEHWLQQVKYWYYYAYLRVCTIFSIYIISVEKNLATKLWFMVNIICFQTKVILAIKIYMVNEISDFTVILFVKS